MLGVMLCSYLLGFFLSCLKNSLRVSLRKPINHLILVHQETIKYEVDMM